MLSSADEGYVNLILEHVVLDTRLVQSQRKECLLLHCCSDSESSRIMLSKHVKHPLSKSGKLQRNYDHSLSTVSEA